MVKDYYEPAEDTFLLLEQVKKYAHGKVLEIGTGSGILAIEAARHPCSVLAVDISTCALKVAQQNARSQKLRNIRFRESDLFRNVSGKFNAIIFNPPYLPQDEGIEDKAIYGGKQGYEVIERFLKEANTHLEEDGIILLLFSSLTKEKIVDRLIEDNLLESQLLSSQRLFFEELYVYLIRKTSLLKTLDKRVRNLHLLAKGHRGYVYTGTFKSRKVAIKIRNPESTAPARIRIEAGFLKILNKNNIGPRLYLGDDEFLIMEYIEGRLILDYLGSSRKSRIISLLRKIFLQLHTLDTLGINKEEMHHPVKHILIRNHRPVLIDFERSRYSEKAHNITQFSQFLSGAHVMEILGKKGIHIKKQEMMAAARGYSRDCSKENLEKIIRIVR
jgi:release factor glutamine methyltransferase